MFGRNSTEFCFSRKLGTEYARNKVVKKIVVEESFKLPVAVLGSEVAVSLAEAKTEIFRKSIHFLIGITPALAALNYSFTIVLLVAGTFAYTATEILRLYGIRVPLISTLTQMASRPRDSQGFVLGPVTLALGALIALTCFSPIAASIGIYALAFGDGFASLVGKLYGRHRPALLFGKSIEGSTACFAAVFVATYMVSHRFVVAFVAAFIATATEALPLEDYDNVALPLIVGLAVQTIFFA